MQNLKINIWVHGAILAHSLFDFAKTITTGEGACYFLNLKKNFSLLKRHDHGHENNPNFPDEEDTRKKQWIQFQDDRNARSCRFSPIKKLNYIIKKQKSNYKKIWKKIEKIPGVESRRYPREVKFLLML